MTLRFLSKLVLLSCIAPAISAQAYACKCGGSPRGKNPWETAKAEAALATAIFEGVPERIEMQSDVLSAKNGDLISADMSSPDSISRARMKITFRVQRTYKGNLGSEVQLNSGLGGGDCGAWFDTGLTALVYAFGPDLGHLDVSMCSPGGWVGDPEQEDRLRFLRNEHPTVSDLALPRRGGHETPAKREHRQRVFEERQQRYASVTGKICGAVLRFSTKSIRPGRISFLPSVGYSPFSFPTEEVKEDGSFCSKPLGPGKYYVYFEGGNEKESTGFFYPGVSENQSATTVTVDANRTASISFTVPTPDTYSVSGFISTDDASDLQTIEVDIALLNMDGRIRYAQTMNFQGYFPLPKTKFFHFGNVLPGHYIAYASVGRGWYTKKQEVDVTTHMKLTSLELRHKR